MRKQIHNTNEFGRYPYGFKTFARIKAWRERRRGLETFIQLELVKTDGTRLRILDPNMENDRFYVLSLAPYYQAWPKAKVAWVVYAKVVTIE